jgi:hypothetical protein
LKTVLSGPVFKTSLKILPVPKSDTVIVCNYYAYDAKNWYAASVNLKVKTRNSTPVLNASIVKKDGAGNTDTLPLPLSQTLVLQQDEWIDFLYSVSDTNDPLSCKAIISRIDNNKNIRFDSATGGIRKAYRLKAADVSPVDTVIIRVTGMDVDTSVHFDTRIIINHPPVIRYCRIDNDTFNHGDTVRVAMQKENRISVAVDDTDCFFWDSLSFRFRAGNQQEILYSGAGETQYSYAAQRSDSCF